MAVEEDMEAVFKSSRTDTDPVSGNEVPTGSLPEEVRDDIPAQLSEGEYVVPADVVRYYGIKFFEDLRMEAKMGWANMEANGRIGGEPTGMEMADDELPFTIAELNVVDADEMPDMNAGGYMMSTDAQMRGFYGGGLSGGLEVREYVGPDGQRIFIQFMGETPLTAIPEGYEPIDTAAEEVAEKVEEQTQVSDNRDDDNNDPIDPPEPIDWKTAKPEVFENYFKQKESGINKVVTAGAAILGGGPMALFMRAATKHQDKRVAEGLRHQLENPDLDPGTRTRLQTLLDNIDAKQEKKPSKDTSDDGKDSSYKIFGGQSSLYEGLTDVSGDGRVSFADTWLGDLLGFDGEAGIGEGNPNLSESRGGARRNNTGGDSPGGVMNTGSSSSKESSSSTVIKPKARPEVNVPAQDNEPNKEEDENQAFTQSQIEKYKSGQTVTGFKEGGYAKKKRKKSK